MKTLYLEKCGCDFWKDDKVNELSDIGNYRVGVYDYSIHGKSGKDYSLEFGIWYIGNIPRMAVTTYFLDSFNNCYGDCELENEINKNLYLFTKKDILKVVNLISNEEYTDIEFI